MIMEGRNINRPNNIGANEIPSFLEFLQTMMERIPRAGDWRFYAFLSQWLHVIGMPCRLIMAAILMVGTGMIIIFSKRQNRVVAEACYVIVDWGLQATGLLIMGPAWVNVWRIFTDL